MKLPLAVQFLLVFGFGMLGLLALIVSIMIEPFGLGIGGTPRYPELDKVLYGVAFGSTVIVTGVVVFSSEASRRWSKAQRVLALLAVPLVGWMILGVVVLVVGGLSLLLPR